MINRLRLLRNIGCFDSVDSAADIPLARLTLIYAENGRGKTTLSAVFRSLGTDDPVPIVERHRLGAPHPPRIVLDCDDSPPPLMFADGGWNRALPNVAVFDDVFVDQNVSSGLVVGSGHRQSLHELILGADGVALNEALKRLVERVEEHNTTLRTKAAGIPTAELRGFSVDDFCALEPLGSVKDDLEAAERQLAAVREQDAVRTTPSFDRLSLPELDPSAIDSVLQQDLPTLDMAAAARVEAHLAVAAKGAEAWVAEGMQRLLPADASTEAETCPFCGQDLEGSVIIGHYRAYFSEAYRDLKTSVAETLTEVNRTHDGDALANLERTVRVAGERRQFWSRFCETPDIAIDTAAIARAWRVAREAVVEALEAKEAAPLERMALSPATRTAVMAYDEHRQDVEAVSDRLQHSNAAINLVKEQASAGDAPVLEANAKRLMAIRARYTPEIGALCDDYLAEKARKVTTEQLRDKARAALDSHRAQAFPGFQTAINTYLGRFNAGFRLDQVVPANTRSGPTCTYNVVINDTPVPVAGGDPTLGQPSFRNTLSAGDRNALALAFFFATLDQDRGLAQKTVVIDDPVSSLDEHRSLMTVQEIRSLSQRTSQVIVLSHTKEFLCRIWDGADRAACAALEVVREGTNSIVVDWDVTRDSVTEHDRRHELFRQFQSGAVPDKREVACAIRPSLEAFLRVAYPEQFPPGTLIGQFRSRCEQQVGSAQEILGVADTQELKNLTEYANKFHHDTNPAWQTESVNDSELGGFVARTLRFMRR